MKTPAPPPTGTTPWSSSPATTRPATSPPGRGIFPNVALPGPINATTLALEKIVSGTNRRASWNDANGNSEIDAGETVYWYWNSGSHVNSLIPLFVKGAGADLFLPYATGSDPVRGAYLDNTDVFKVMDAVLPLPPAQVSAPAIQISGSDIVLTWPAVTTDVAGQPLTPTGYQIHQQHLPLLPAQRRHPPGHRHRSDIHPHRRSGTGLHFYTILPIAGPTASAPPPRFWASSPFPSRRGNRPQYESTPRHFPHKASRACQCPAPANVECRGRSPTSPMIAFSQHLTRKGASK